MSLLEMVKSYSGRDVILDANLLLLYFFGSVFPERIATWKRTRPFGRDDFQLLSHLLSQLGKVIVTPNTMTEATNFLVELDSEKRELCFRFIKERIEVMNEEYCASKDVLCRPHCSDFGISDFALLEVARHRCLALTADAQLAAFMWANKIHAVNFNHLRQFNWKMLDG